MARRIESFNPYEELNTESQKAEETLDMGKDDINKNKVEGPANPEFGEEGASIKSARRNTGEKLSGTQESKEHSEKSKEKTTENEEANTAGKYTPEKEVQVRQGDQAAAKNMLEGDWPPMQIEKKEEYLDSQTGGTEGGKASETA